MANDPAKVPLEEGLVFIFGQRAQAIIVLSENVAAFCGVDHFEEYVLKIFRLVERWTFAILRPSLASCPSRGRGMLKLRSLEKAITDGRWYDDSSSKTPGQDPCSNGCSEDSKKKQGVSRCVVILNTV